MSDRLQVRFVELWSRTVGGGADTAWRAINDGYGAASRRYNGWDHIADLLAGHDIVRVLPDFAGLDGDALDLAVFFHDAVYDTGRTDNEVRSAELLAESAGPAAGAQRLRSAGAMIRATAAHGPSADPATRLLLDLDLAVLGAPPPVYAAYAAAIRREHEVVPDAAWRFGRASVLDRFLARPRLYQTDHFHDRLEAAARRNFADETRMLCAAMA